MIQLLENSQNEYIFLLTSEKCKYCVEFVPTIKMENWNHSRQFSICCIYVLLHDNLFHQLRLILVKKFAYN